MRSDDERVLKPAHLTIEEWLLAENIEWLRRLHVQSRKTVRLKRTTLAVLFVVFVLVVALMLQVKARNDRLDELKATTTRIEEIAEEFRRSSPDPAVARGLAQIDALCDRLACEEQP